MRFDAQRSELLTSKSILDGDVVSCYWTFLDEAPAQAYHKGLEYRRRRGDNPSREPTSPHRDDGLGLYPMPSERTQ